MSSWILLTISTLTSIIFSHSRMTLDHITRHIRHAFKQFTDLRRGRNMRYTLVDAGLSAFSVFFMQLLDSLYWWNHVENCNSAGPSSSRRTRRRPISR